MCRTASVAVRCSRPACSVGSPILGAAAASAVRPASFRNRLRSSMGAAILYGAGVPRNRRPARALDTGVTLATGGARTPRFFGASAAQANGRPRWVEHCCSPASKRCPMTHRSLLLRVSLALVASLALAPLSAHAAGVPCAALTSVAIADTTITSATIVAALGTAPEHCLVIGHVDTEINFELRLPTTTWNGKFYHAGGGGFVGSIPSSPGALARGYAVIGTDTGHVGDGPFAPALDGSWALNNLVRQVNFGHRAVHVVTVAGKKILHAFYGQTERLAYFEGCSNGGRQAMQEAARDPTRFDGIIAGAPRLDSGWPAWRGAGAATGWPSWTPASGGLPPLQFLFADGYLRYFVFDPGFNLLTSDLESDVRAMRPTGKFLNATNADLSDFRAAGGKLIMWHGWADAALTAFRSIAYLQEAAEKTKHGHRLGEFFRLFLAPGMHHCGGGPGPNTLDALSALESWVEHAIAPEQIVATHRTGTVVDRTRPLCAYPKEATYKGPGSMDDASSFVCRVPRDLFDRHDRFDDKEDHD